MKKILAIVCARDSSKRLPNKNRKKIDGVCLVERAVRSFYDAEVENIVVATDYNLEFDLNKYNAKHIQRSPNISKGHVALQDTVKWVYNSLGEEYEYIAFLMPNCPQIDSEAIKKALALLNKKKFNIIRSYNKDGFENGLVIARTKYLQDHFTDVYCGGIVCEGKEIHDEEDYNSVKKMMESDNA